VELSWQRAGAEFDFNSEDSQLDVWDEPFIVDAKAEAAKEAA
jgi:hypothetical protein